MLVGMNILLTNDDGIESAGLSALAQSLAHKGHSIYMVAPSACRSASSMSLSVGKKIKLSKRSVAFTTEAYALDGTSVDCVKLALVQLDFPQIDLVVSGINIGLNVARDLHYSATVGAAIEAVLTGIPAIAISAEFNEKHPCRFDDACAVLSLHFDTILQTLQTGCTRQFANINVPFLPYKEVCITRAAWDLVYDDRYEKTDHFYELVGPRNNNLTDRAFDLGALNDGCASISYLAPSWNI